jgi:two-component system sensor histidine kinase CpxA
VRQISDDKTVTAIILPADKNVEEYTPLYLVAIHDRLPNISVFTYTFIEYFKELLMHLIVISVTSFFLARHFTKPMKMLNDASERIADGVFDIQLDEVAERKDEFGELARKFMEMVERLEENMQQQRRMFRDISHELRSPLTRMRLALEIASSKTDGEAAELMKRVETEWERMSFMINDLKKIASCSDASIPMEQIDICELLDSLMPDFLFESRALGLNVTLECSNCCKINGNRRLLASAFENIVRNALRYAKKDIKINVIMGNRNVVVSVLDDGNGVEPDNLEKIFLPFFKEDQNRDRASGGTGLGLAIAKKIVSSHSGEIHAKKPAEGGLKIIMSFPV